MNCWKTVFIEVAQCGAEENSENKVADKKSEDLTWERYCAEIRPFWLLVTKGYGFTVHDIDTSCPADLKPYADVYNLEKKQRDNDMWMWFGTYGLSAVSVAVEHCLAGKKLNQSM